MSVNEKMTAIADNIRTKTGKAEPMSLDAMASGVNEVYDTGVEAGVVQWENMFLGNPVKARFQSTFSRCDFHGYEFRRTLKPSEYYPYSLSRMFYNYKGSVLPKNIDLSGATQNSIRSVDAVTQNLFTWGEELIIPDYGLPALDFGESFCHLSYAEIIEKIRIGETNTPPKFTGCYALRHITFEGVIGKSVSFSDSPLTVKSMKNIISCLKDYSQTENAGKYTLTLKDSCKTLITQQGAIEEFGGKTYDQYITDIGWNLA